MACADQSVKGSVLHSATFLLVSSSVHKSNSRSFEACRWGHRWGHPLGRLSTGKKVFVPNFFLIGLTYRWQSLLRSARSEPFISSFDCGRFPPTLFPGRGDPFSHPSGSSARQQVRAAHPPFEPKGTGGARPLPVPSGSLFFVHPPNTPGLQACQAPSARFSYYVFLGGACAAFTHRYDPQLRAGNLVRPTRHRESRKRSVPVRVHSVRQSSGFAGSGCPAPAANPLLTRGTVESPAKLSLQPSCC